MSQVLAAKSALAPGAQAQGTIAAARKNDCFAAVFDQARKASLQERQPNDRLAAIERSRERERSRRTDEQASADEDQAARAQEAQDAAEPGRAEQLQAAAEQARTERPVPTEPDPRSIEARQEAEPEADTSAQRSTAESRREAKEAHQESNDYGFQPQPYADATFIPQTPTPDYSASGSGGDAGGTGVAGGAAGAAAGMSDRAVPLSSSSGGSGSAAPAGGLTASAGRAQDAAAGMRDAGGDATGANGGGKARSAAGPEGQSKSTAGTDFQTILGQTGRTRQSGSLLRAATATATAKSDAAEKPIKLDSAAGPGDLARVLRSKVGARHSNMTIQLDPPELGRVRVDVRMHDEAMTVRFEAQTQAGHDALQGRLRELTGALEQQGVRLDRVEVELRPPPDQQPDGQSAQQHTGQQAGQEPRYAGESGSWQDRSAGQSFGGDMESEGAVAAAAASVQTGWLSASGVDVVI